MIRAICHRRSCRTFLQSAVEREKLEAIVKTALHAPSARNRQLWQFTVVSDGALMEELRAAVAKALGREGEYGFYGAPVLILCSNDREHPYGREDCACAMENMMLASDSLELGSVWINQLTAVCDEEGVRGVLRRLGVPDNHVVYGSAAIGYPAALPREKEIVGKVVWN